MRLRPILAMLIAPAGFVGYLFYIGLRAHNLHGGYWTETWPHDRNGRATTAPDSPSRVTPCTHGHRAWVAL
jgi:hypothetical protein